jgi:hypothetical protein
LKGPASNKPSACSQCRFPGKLVGPVLIIDGRSRNVRQKDVAFRRIAVLAKHRIYSLCELSAARFVDATSIDPEVLQAIASGLFSAESDLVKTSLARLIPIYHVPKSDFLRSPYVREDSISGNIVKELHQTELAIVIID